MASDEGDSDSEFTGIREELVDGLKYVEDIAEQLTLTRALPKITVEEILHKEKTLTQWGEELLDAIQRHCAYDIFSDCLRVSGQDELYQLMVCKVHVKRVTYELTTLQYRVYCKDGRGDPREILVPPHIQDRLEAQREALQKMQNLERLVDLMKDEGCLTAVITRAITDQPDTKEKANMLIDNVKKSTLYSFFVLVRFLDISQQKELVSKITEKHTKTALGLMDDLLLNIYYNLLAFALKESELEEILDVEAREFVTLTIKDSNAVDSSGLGGTHVDHSMRRAIKLTELFSDQENNKPTRTVLLEGAPGAGKTKAITQFAREATSKNTPNVKRPPFVILLRSVDWTTETSLKRLLLRYGPHLAEKEQDDVWRVLSGKATEITIILDGADEVPGGFFMSKPARVSGVDIPASPKFILNNLISGKLLTGVHVLVSSRPFGLVECWNSFDRKVNVSGFNEESLSCFLNNELEKLPPQHLTEVQSFLAERIDIRSLLLIPLHAATFVTRVKYAKHTDHWRLQSRTELSLSLIDTSVKRKLCKVHGKTIPEEQLEEQGKNLRKLCKLVAELLCSEGAVKIEMTRKDLKEKVKVAECVATGLFSEQVLVDDDVSKSILVVPHQSILESLAALGLDKQQIFKLVAENDGRHDLVLTYVVGILGNENNRKMLKYVLSKDDEEKDFKKLVEVVVRAILGSKRRVLGGGEEFCQRIVVESQQWGLIADLMHVMKSRWLTPCSSEALITADQLIRLDPRGNTDDPSVRVEVHDISSVRCCPGATVLWHCGDEMVADMAVNVKHLHNISCVIFTSAIIVETVAGITRETEVGITRDTMAGVVAELSKLDNVKAVDVFDNTVGSASTDELSVLGCLSSISSLQYLRLSGCGLSSNDVVAVTSSCRHLIHLDISGNEGVRGGDVRSEELTGLNVARCGMEGEELVEMAARNGERLTFLNASGYTSDYNPVLTSTHINALLTHCPRLVELYTDGDELVRALSERREACRLNHLLLCYRDLSSSSLSDDEESSSSSSDDQVNSSQLSDVLTRHPTVSSFSLCCCLSSLTSSDDEVSDDKQQKEDVESSLSSSGLPSELSDVLTRHPSISSLTLYECRHFTPDFMSHLSSFMVSITSLYISPIYPHRTPRSTDVASLVQESPGLTRLWLDNVHQEWHASDYMKVFDAVNTSPALSIVGLDVGGLSVDEVCDVVRALKRRLTRLWLAVDYRKSKEDYAEVVLEEGEVGVIQLLSYGTDALYNIYSHESGSCHQHLPPSLPNVFRPTIS